MARHPPRQLRKNPHHDSGPQGIRLFYAILILLVASSLGLILRHYNPFSSLEWPVENADENDAQVRMLYDDVDVAKMPFDPNGFDLSQIFGARPFWGSLNSGHYFGLKLSTPNSLETSLMWFKNELNDHRRLNIRHLCDQNDRLDYYAWTKHDFWTFGQQTIQDGPYRLSTSYLKDSDNPSNWESKLSLDLDSNGGLTKPLSMIQYILTDHQTDTLKLVKSTTKQHSRLDDGPLFVISGTSRDLGRFNLSVDCDSSGRQDLIRMSYFVGYIDRYRVPVSDYLHSKMMVAKYNKTNIFQLSGTIQLEQGQQPNIIAVQLIFKASATMNVQFKLTDDQVTNLTSKQDKQLAFKLEDYDRQLALKLEDYDRQFSNKFPLVNLSESTKRLAQVALSNMIGSIGYFYGNAYIGSSFKQDKIVPYGPIQLLTAVPSRSFFPRGFLWDEGFHNLLISQWDPEISNKIIISWFKIMNTNGWIPREVILGVESMRRVPNEFIVQRIANANPPAMLLVIERMLEAGTLLDDTLENLYPRLKQWFSWFNMTQFGPRHDTFRWRGRDELSVNMLNPKTLTSGLDDYPRASHPSPLEYHVDLRCWIALAARTLSKLAQKIGDRNYYKSISSMATDLSDDRSLAELHWSDEHKMYCDFGMNTESAQLVWVTKTRRSQNHGNTETYKKLERQSVGQPKFGCVPEFGYVSLFPLIMRIVDPQSDRLGIILKRLRDENELWTPFGIRSLSKSSHYYGKYNTEHDKPYWRGAIWLNMNYLILSSLKHYANIEGPHKIQCSNSFHELRDNIVRNVQSEFERSNYIWENYDDTSGRGQGSHPFTGWSSLILLIMSNL